MRLKFPRLLPATIVAMFALFVSKSVMLVQAAAEEPSGTKTTAPSLPGPSAAAAPTDTAPARRASEPASASAPASARKEAPPAAPLSESERAVLMALRERREALDARARMLDQRAAELAAADRRLDDRVQQLSALQTRLEALESSRQSHRAENWTGLVKTYEAMKPREAAAIFDALDMQVLLQVLDRMQERRAAPVLAAMQPDRARLATQLLAEMRTRAVTPPDPAATPIVPKG